MISQSVTFLNPCAVSSLGRKMKNPNPVKSKDPLNIGDRRGGKMDRYVSRMIDLRVHVKLPFILPFQQKHVSRLDVNASPFHRDLMSATGKWAADLIYAVDYEVSNTLWDSDLIDQEGDMYDNGDILLYRKSYTVYSVGKLENALLQCDASCGFWWAELDVLRASTNNTSWLNDLLTAIRRAFSKMGMTNLEFNVTSKSRGGVLYITIYVKVPWQVVMRYAGLGDKYGG